MRGQKPQQAAPPQKQLLPPAPTESRKGASKTPPMPSEGSGPQGHRRGGQHVKPAKQGAAVAAQTAAEVPPAPATQGRGIAATNAGSGSANSQNRAPIAEPLPESVRSHDSRIRGGSGQIQGGTGANADTAARMKEGVGVARHAGHQAEHSRGGGHHGGFKGGHGGKITR